MPRLKSLHCVLLAFALLALPDPTFAGEVEPLLRKGHELAAHEQQAHIRVRLLAEVGAACAATGHHELAEKVFRDAARDAEDADDRDKLLAVLAAGCAGGGLCDLAREFAAGISPPEQRAEALLNAAGGAATAGEKAARFTPLLDAAVSAVRQESSPARRARHLARAAVLYAQAGLSDRAGTLLDEARQIVERMEDRAPRTALLAELAAAYCRASREGQVDAMLADITNPPSRAAVLLRCANALLDRDRPAAAHDYLSRALEMEQELKSRDGIEALLDAAGACVGSKHPGAAERLLRAADRILVDSGLRPGLLTRLAYLYGELGLWEDAARIEREKGNSGQACRYELKAILQRARSGDRREAFKQLLDLEGAYADHVGPQLLAEVYELHLSERPDTQLGELKRLGPVGTEYVAIRALAENAVRRSEYDAVIPLVGQLHRAPAHQAVVEEVALYALRHAGSGEAGEAIGLARDVLEMLKDPLRHLNVLFEVGWKARQVGDRKMVREVAGEMVGLLPKWDLGGEEALQLVRAAILENELGREEKALALVSTAMPRAQRIGCASCRIDTLQGIFDGLRRAAARKLLFAALEATYRAETQLEQALATLEAFPRWPSSDQRRLLRLALRGALGRDRQEQRVRALLRVVDAYHRRDLAPRTPALRIVAQTPLEPSRRLPAPEESAEELIRKLNAAPPVPVRLVFFTDSNCTECAEAKKLLSKIEERLTNLDLAIKEYDLEASTTNAHINEVLCAHLQQKERRGTRPAVFSSGRALFEEEITEANLLALIADARYKPSPEQVYAQTGGDPAEAVRKEYEALAFLSVVGGGLADGVNPCAFTVIIFLLSYLALVGKDRRQMAMVAGVFAAAVFLTYFGAGLGLSAIVARLTGISQAVRVALYGSAAALLLAAAVLSFRDAWLCARGRSEQMTLALPGALKSKIRRKISRQTRLGLTMGGTAALGVVVALFELPCTGQVYIPIILALHELPQYFWGPVGWLLLYNVCFIVPLVAVVGAVLYGLTAEQLADLFRRHVAKTKLALGGVFALLCALMLALIFWRPA